MSEAPADAGRLAGSVTILGDLGPRLFRVALAGGLAALAGAAALGLAAHDGMRRFAFSYLLGFSTVLTLSLGALFFVALHHVTRSTWSVVVRRLAEVIAANMPLLIVLAIPVLVNLPALYGWARPDAGALPASKHVWLSTPFFAGRLLLYLAFWSWLGRRLWRRSLEQDTSGDPAVSVGLARLSAWGLVAFALTLTFGAFDLMMSIDPTWTSTIFGVYVFAGCAVGGYALLTLLSLGLQRSGRLEHVVSMEHYHDLGKLMFTFVFFWGYIAFSQYLLVWYGNLPEETGWYLRRQTGSWAGVGLALLFGQLLLPFAGLISRWAKRSRAALAFWAAWILVMHWIDLYWVIMPELSPQGIAPHALDLLCTLGVGGIWAAGVVRLAGTRSLVPRGDPLLAESLSFENA